MARRATTAGGEEISARPSPSRAAKRAEQTADRIVSDVIAMGWPAGALLGSEAGLLERYGVSRAVFREAVRLVEHQQVARTRRGPGGGLVITEPSVGAVIDAVVLYLYRVQARLGELFEARIVLEEIVTNLATDRLDEQGLALLRTFLRAGDPDRNAGPRALHALLASITRNPVLELFVDVLNRVTLLYSTEWQALGPAIGLESARAHARIAEAVIAGEARLAGSRMRRHLEAERDFLHSRRSTTELLPDHVVVVSEPGDGKRAEAVARRITQEIVGGGMPPGALVGAEKDLIEQEGVSRAVLREAVRLLEHHQIARMRRGPGGGLFVFEPSAGAVTEVAAIYLARHGVRLASLGESRTTVEVALAGLAAERIDAGGAALLREAIGREQAADGDEQNEAADLHAAVARAARSSVLELVALVLVRLSRLSGIEQLTGRARRQAHADMVGAHEGIAVAVQAGDRELAMHLMRRHLEELGAMFGATGAPGSC
jgi:DNA-binding FadR family transcriptional regulator